MQKNNNKNTLNYFSWSVSTLCCIWYVRAQPIFGNLACSWVVSLSRSVSHSLSLLYTVYTINCDIKSIPPKVCVSWYLKNKNKRSPSKLNNKHMHRHTVKIAVTTTTTTTTKSNVEATK